MRIKTTNEMTMLCAAYLAGEGRKQIEIAQILNISQAAVSRLLEEARLGLYLHNEVRFLREKVDSETLEMIQRTIRRRLGEQLDALSERYGFRAPVVRVFPSGSKNENAMNKRLAEFS